MITVIIKAFHVGDAKSPQPLLCLYRFMAYMFSLALLPARTLSYRPGLSTREDTVVDPDFVYEPIEWRVHWDTVCVSKSDGNRVVTGFWASQIRTRQKP